MNIRNDQSGMGAVEILLILVVIGILGFTGWFVWQSQQTANNTLDATNKSQIATYAKKEAPKTSTNQNQSQEYLDIKEWGVRIKLTDAEKISYSIDNTARNVLDIPVVGYVDPRFKPEYLKDKSCTPGVGLYRSTEKSGRSDKQIGNYWYFVAGAPGACSDDPENNPDDILKNRFLQEFTSENVESIPS